MIKIIKHGKELKEPKKDIITTRCPECGCIFKIDHNRIFCKDYIYCPDCWEEIIVHDTSSITSDDPNKIMCEIL